MCPYTTAMLINQAIINCIFVLLTLLSLPQANGRTIWQFEIEWQSNRTTIVDNWQFKDMYVFLIILQPKDIEVWDWCSFLSYQKSRVCMPCYGMFADIRTQSSLSIFSYNYHKHFLIFFWMSGIIYTNFSLTAFHGMADCLQPKWSVLRHI